MTDPTKIIPFPSRATPREVSRDAQTLRTPVPLSAILDFPRPGPTLEAVAPDSHPDYD